MFLSVKLYTSITNLSSLRFEFSKTVFWRRYVFVAHSLHHQYLWLLVLDLNFPPSLSLHFLQVPSLGNIPICCSSVMVDITVIIFWASNPLVEGKHVAARAVGCTLSQRINIIVD